MTPGTPVIVLAIGGSDSGAGAGIQADLKAIAANGGYAATVVTAVTAQNTIGVDSVHHLPIDVVAAQIQAVLSDIAIGAVKTGFLGRPEVVQLVADHTPPGVPLVVDPVLVDSAGRQIVEDATVHAYRDILGPAAVLITPNFREAALLTGLRVGDVATMEEAAFHLSNGLGTAVLVKGGHLDGEMAIDVLVSNGEATRLSHPRVDSPNVHGTGCSTASAIALALASGDALDTAVAKTKTWISHSIVMAEEWRIGSGQGPIDPFGPNQESPS